MGVGELAGDFREFLKLLNVHHAEYLLIGGHAVAYHGFPRATGDMDIWIAMTPENGARIVKVLADFGFGKTGATPQMFQEEDRIIRMGRAPLRIEILTTISGVSFAECYERRQTVQVSGIAVPIIGLEDLVKNKAASVRPKDRIDCDELRKRLKPGRSRPK